MDDLGVAGVDLAFAMRLPSRSKTARFSGFRLSKELVAVSKIVSVLGIRTLKFPWWLIEMAPVRTKKFAPSTAACRNER